MIIDVLAVLPFYLPFVGVDLRFIRAVRLFRLFRRVVYNKRAELVGG